MNGRELIVYILENHLENEPIFEDGKFIGFMTETEAAEKFDVGVETVRVWIKYGALDYIEVGETIFIPCNATVKREV